ncbi:hypothetical protein O6H91_02G060300 [Diphasiastrum complanatum]|uniref:Uncharacterized protein n=1 Tax=Diphasiastrum complanatum TaxID=34168 RepID=A0ACC2EGF9_DIPCM|nr:hypothetical protein O6H91_02G060300 [Diphasiastrum complanatum]
MISLVSANLKCGISFKYHNISQNLEVRHDSVFERPILDIRTRGSRPCKQIDGRREVTRVFSWRLYAFQKKPPAGPLFSTTRRTLKNEEFESCFPIILNRIPFFSRGYHSLWNHPVYEVSSGLRTRWFLRRCIPSHASNRHGLWLSSRVFLHKAGAALALIFFLTLSILYGQSRARAYIQNEVLPPIATLLGAYCCREVKLGNVQKLSLFKIKLTSCSVGTHEDEFSCGELPDVEIRLRPVHSLLRGQIVLDAMVLQPVVLVSQRQDWSWLGIPTPSAKQLTRQSSEPSLDFRRKIRRAAREETAVKWSRSRDAAARSSAQLGYRLIEVAEELGGPKAVDEIDNSFLEKNTTTLQEKWDVGTVNGSNDEIIQNDQKFAVQTEPSDGNTVINNQVNISDRTGNDFSRMTAASLRTQIWLRRLMKLRSDEDENVSKSLHFHWSISDVTNWLHLQFLRPMKSQLLRMWTHSEMSPVMKVESKRRILHESAATALAWFLKYDEQKPDRVEENSPANSGLMTKPGDSDVEHRKTLMDRHDDAATKASIAYVPEREIVPNSSTRLQTLSGNENTAKPNRNMRAENKGNMWPVFLDSVYFADGTFMLLAYGDRGPRLIEEVKGSVRFSNNYEQLNVHLTGRPREWRTVNATGNGGTFTVDVDVDIPRQKWHASIKGQNLFAPLGERLLEIPLDWSDGRVDGEVNIWMDKDDTFPSFTGKIDVKELEFHIWEAPSRFKGVHGTLFFQDQRVFFHNAVGCYGAIPLNVSGDIDLNPESGEYRLSCQASGVEVNALMDTLDVQPPPFPLSGVVRAIVYCRGPLDAPIFDGSAESIKHTMDITSTMPPSVASAAIQRDNAKGAVAAYDRVAFSSVSANFTFNSDNCVADIFGIKATPIAGGEIRGAGDMWICPEGESDPTAINIDFSGQFPVDETLQDYVPNLVELPAASFGPVKVDANIRGPLLMPVFDIKWATLEAKGPFNGARGSINISHEAVVINSSAFTFDLYLKAHIVESTMYNRKEKQLDYMPARFPRVEGLDADLRLRAFDVMRLTASSPPLSLPSSDDPHVKVSGRLKLHGRVTEGMPSPFKDLLNGQKGSPAFGLGDNFGMVGDVWLSGIKLNQLLIAPQLAGSLEVSPTSFKLHTSGRPDEHFHIQFFRGRQQVVTNVSIMDSSLNQAMIDGLSVSLQRGQLRINILYHPQYFAKLEVRNLLLDELEIASLRGAMQKVEVKLNLKKRRGHGNLSVRRPRFSGVQGESLDLSARWSGDVVTLEKSVLEQAISRYELQGEYVLPGPRDRGVSGNEKKNDGMWENMMAGQLKSIITSLGRWRLRFEVPRAEISEMLPLARLLARSTDPAVVWRSKELFVQGVENLGLGLDNLKQQLEYFKRIKPSRALEEGTREPMPLPKLEELKGHWYGAVEASGGGNGDTTADFDLHGEEWEWGRYKTQRVTVVGGYGNADGLRLEKIFIQKDAATLHADGTLLGPNSNLHFAVLNFPIELVPPLLHAFSYSTLKSSPLFIFPHSSANGILHMEGDLRGHLNRPQCDVQVRLLDGILGGVSLRRAEVSASITSANRFFFSAVLEPAVQSGHVHVKGSFPMGSDDQRVVELDNGMEKKKTKSNRWMNQHNWSKEGVEACQVNDKNEVGEENFDLQLGDTVKAFKGELVNVGALYVDAAVKDGGMRLITAVTPYADWLQGNADIKLQVRGTVEKPEANGNAVFHRVTITSPFMPKPVFGLGGTVALERNELHVAGLEGRVGKRGHLEVRGKLPIHFQENLANKSIEVKAECLEIRARNMYSGQVDGQVRITSSLLEPEVTGVLKLSHGEAYLSQEKSLNAISSTIPGTPGRGYSWITSKERVTQNRSPEVIHFPGDSKETSMKDEFKTEPNANEMPVAVRLKALKLHLGPELRMVYPLILNFAVSGELELSGFADPLQVKPKGTLTFENGDVNLVATQVRLNRDYPNRAKFEPEQGLDPSLDLALIGADWQLKVQGRARNWQDNLVITSTRSGEQDALTRIEAAKVFESQLAESLLEGDGQIAFKKLAAATVETLMPKIETKGEFGQARWRLVYAPQIPNLLSLDPTTDPFKSLANLSFGTEVEVQLGAHLQASVVRQLKESEMATQWTLIYQLNSKVRILFSSIPTVDNRLLLEYSATSQN